MRTPAFALAVLMLAAASAWATGPAAKPKSAPAKKPAAKSTTSKAPDRPSNPIKAQPVPKAPVPAQAPAAPPAPATVAPPAPPTPSQLAEAKLREAEALAASGTGESLVASLIPFEQAAQLARDAGDRALLVRAKVGKGLALSMAEPESSDGAHALDEAEALARAPADQSLIADVLEAQAQAAGAAGKSDVALARWRAAALAHQAAGEFEAEGLAHLAASHSAEDSGLAPDALAEAASALATFRHLGRESLEVQALLRRAELEAAASQDEACLSSLGEALSHLDEADDPGLEGRALVDQARALRRLGRLPPALASARDAATSCHQAADRACEADALELQGAVQLALGEAKEASQPILEALRARREIGDAAGEGRAQQGLGVALSSLGRHEPALAAFREAEPLLAQHGTDSERAAVLLDMARALSAMREDQEAVSAYDAAVQALRVAGTTAARGEGFSPPADLAQALREELELTARIPLWTRALEVSLALDLAESGRADLRPPDIDAVRSATRRENAALLHWRLLPEQVLAFAVDSEGAVSGRSVQGIGADAARRLASTCAALAAERARGGSAPSEDDPLQAALRRAHDLLVAPVLEALPAAGAPGSGLLLVPGRDLVSLPFALLQDENGAALGEAHELAEVGAATLAVESATPSGSGLLVVDAPGLSDFGPDLLAVHEGLTGKRKLKGGDEAALGVVTEEATTWLVGSAAAEEPLRARAASAAVTVLLGACAAAARAGEERGLVMERRGAEAKRDGFLSAAEAQELTLPGSVVVLAGCDSTADAAFVAALRRAGARSVITPALALSEDARRAALADLVTRLAKGTGPAASIREGRAALAGSAPAALLPAAWDLDGSLR